jgi:hypothetical protein
MVIPPDCCLIYSHQKNLKKYAGVTVPAKTHAGKSSKVKAATAITVM